MKIVYVWVLICTILISCSSSKSYLKRGDYYNATLKAAQKLKRKQDSEKNILALEKAYPLAIKQIREKISYLQKEGRPDRWEQVLNHYTQLKKMQTEVEKVTPIKYKSRTIKYEHIDYDSEIITARRKAADYLYAHAKKLLQSNNKQSCRDAYFQFIDAKEYNPSLTDIDKLIRTAKERGTSYVNVVYTDHVRPGLPSEFGDELLSFGSDRLDDEWTVYNINPNSLRNNADYIINIKMKRVNVSPEQISDKTEVYERKMSDGWEYVLDRKGNVMKDSLGNDIKRQKYKFVTCHVTETVWFKSAGTYGTIEIRNASTNRKLVEKQLGGEIVFENVTFQAKGDLNALSDEVLKMLDNKPVPFPRDIDMIFDTIGELRAQIRSIIKNNKHLLR